MNRRHMLIVLGTSALAPLFSFAQQQGKVWRIGFLAQSARPDNLESSFYNGFVLGMRDLGYIEGNNLEIEWRFAGGKVERLPGLAAELLRLKMDVLVTSASSSTSAAQKATSTIPIVMVAVGDPVDFGFVKSLAWPGGNITGLSNLSIDTGIKTFEMLMSMVPKLARVAVMVNPDNIAGVALLRSVRGAAQKIGVTILPLDARTLQEVENGFSRAVREKAGGLIVTTDPNFNQQSRQIAELAAKHRLPTVAGLREYAEAGGLMSYGANRTDYFRRAATYVDKIFKGAKPADLPVEQPTKFEMFINGKTAKALGLRIPQSLLISTDKVIE